MVITKEIKSKFNNINYNKNKNKLLSNMKEKINCKCGITISKINLYRHLKTKKHLNNIKI